MNQPSIKKNFIMNALLTISSFIFPLITFPYISRILSPEGIGKVSFANSVVAYFALFAQLGIPTYGVRACAKVRDNKKELSQTVQEIFYYQYRYDHNYLYRIWHGIELCFTSAGRQTLALDYKQHNVI